MGHVELNLGCELQDRADSAEQGSRAICGCERAAAPRVTADGPRDCGNRIQGRSAAAAVSSARELQKEIRTAGQAPVLAPSFESNIPRAFIFAGATAANSFGPLLRFACGAGFTARHITKQLVHSSSRRSVAASASRAEDAFRSAATGCTGRSRGKGTEARYSPRYAVSPGRSVPRIQNANSSGRAQRCGYRVDF